MNLTVEIPDELANELASHGKEPARAVLEAIAHEGYCRDWLSEAGVRRLLGFETRMEVHEFLADNDVYLDYTIKDLEHDAAEGDRYLALKQARFPTEMHGG